VNTINQALTNVEKYVGKTILSLGPVLKLDLEPNTNHFAAIVNRTVAEVAGHFSSIRHAIKWKLTIEWSSEIDHWENLLDISMPSESELSETTGTSHVSLVSDRFSYLRANLVVLTVDADNEDPFKSEYFNSFIRSVFDNVGLELFTLFKIASEQCNDVRYNVAQKMLELSSLIFEEGVIDSFMSELVVLLNEYTTSEVSAMSLTTWSKDEGVFHIPAVFEQGKMALENDRFPLMMLQNRPIYKVIETGIPLVLSRTKSQQILSAVNIHRTKASATVIMPLSLGERGGALTISSSQCEMFNGIEIACFNSAATALGTVYRRNMLQSETYKQANFDALTGVANRSNFERFLGQLVINDGEFAGLLYLDLDKFKPINDEYGHCVGDEFLKIVAKRFEAQLRDHDLVARRGGDEFAIVLTKLDGPDIAERVAKRIIKSLQDPVDINGVKHTASASIGICVFNNIVDVSLAIKRADIAMYKAKDAGRGNYQFYNE
jgi:diguanylate cyclase (GGDEF)-like protein